MFEKISLKEFGKNFFDNLNPLKAPYYFIVLACTISIVASCEYLDGIKWYTLFIMISILLLMAMYFAARSQSTDKKKEILSELRIARVTGIAVALIGVTYASNNTKFIDAIFIAVLLTSFFQIVYLWFIPEKKFLSFMESKEGTVSVINIPQMTLITNILLITFFTLSSSLAIRYKVHHQYQEEVINVETEYPNIKKFVSMDPNAPFIKLFDEGQESTAWYDIDYAGQISERQDLMAQLKAEL